jgi:pimeloyl-ACP methyl ester carboxylesterase
MQFTPLDDILDDSHEHKKGKPKRRVARALAAGSFLLVGVDVASSPFLNDQTVELTSHDSERDVAHEDSLIVYFPGMFSDGEVQSQPIQSTLLSHGDLLTVSSYGNSFDGNEIATDTATEVKERIDVSGYKKLTVVASSMGAKVAFEMLVSLQDGIDTEAVDINFIAIDGVESKADIKGGTSASIVSEYPAGVLSNTIPLVKTFVHGPNEADVAQNADEAQLEAGLASVYANNPTSRMLDQLEYLTDGRMSENSLGTMVDTFTYIESTRDTTVVDSEVAKASWANIMGASSIYVVPVDAQHTALDAQPNAYNDALEEILASQDGN